MSKPISVTFTMDVKNRPQVAVLLFTLQAAGCDLKTVIVRVPDGDDLDGLEALNAWQRYVKAKKGK
jgi:hypothetical protein